MKIFKRVLVSLAVLFFALIVAAYTLLERTERKPPVLKDHPNAVWSGGPDGGVFFEITKADPPAYYVEVRYESGGIWAEGWVKYVVKDGGRLTNKDFLVYDGGDEVYLQDETELKLNSTIVK